MLSLGLLLLRTVADSATVIRLFSNIAEENVFLYSILVVM
jgi:hypothetical protein